VHLGQAGTRDERFMAVRKQVDLIAFLERAQRVLWRAGYAGRVRVDDYGVSGYWSKNVGTPAEVEREIRAIEALKIGERVVRRRRRK
jgi:hypothetical protein